MYLQEVRVFALEYADIHPPTKDIRPVILKFSGRLFAYSHQYCNHKRRTVPRMKFFEKCCFYLISALL